MRQTAFRLGGTALAMGFAVLALGSGLNRMSAYRADAASVTPALFRTQAARMLAAQAIAREDLTTAQVEARRAVLRDPIDTQSLGLFGQAALAAGQAEPARAAFTLSGQLGWREPATQAFWMASALQAGELDAAAQRLDAILRQQPTHPQRATLLGLFEANEAGQFRIAERLRLRPAWAVPYFHMLADLPAQTLTARSIVGVELAATYGLRDCAMVAPLVGELTNRDNAAAAFSLWSAQCRAPADTALLADGGFETARLAQPPTPFDWQFSNDGALSMALGKVPGFNGQALTLMSDASGELQAAIRQMRLPAGRYTATWRARDIAGNAAPAIGLSVSCDRSGRRLLPASLHDQAGGGFAATIQVAADCPTQWLSINIAAKADSVTVDDLAITRE
jgi:hypothetical protein